MMKIRNSLMYLFVTISIFLFSCLSLDAAGSVSTSMSGSNSVYVGNTIDVTLSVTGVNGVSGGGLTGIAGSISYDSNYLEYVSFKSLAPFEINYSNSSRVFTGFDTTGGSKKISGNSDIIRITFRTKAVGNTTVKYVDTDASDLNDEAPYVSGASKTISITNPPSSNANLSSLSISGASINFNANTTSYNVKVGKDVSSVSISATAEDSGARVSGTGNKSINYGNNNVSVTVTAPSGATKTYTISITREDPRSSNANLTSLKVDGGEISPVFNQNTTIYEVSVPFSVENLNLKAVTQDSKAKVSISGAEGLIAEETKDVTVTVTAENGTRKTYTIKVTRGKDPNKVLSTNNYLSSITTNQGILSPVFDKEKTNYIIYLPYEIDTIELNASVEDTKYGTITNDGPEKLNVGSNKYTFTVSAEDSSTRVYTVIVMRGASLEDVNISSSVLLKELNVIKGNLDKPFNSKVNVYKYDKSKGFKLNPIPEDEETKVTVLENNDVISIILESDTDTNIYTLIPEEESVIWLIVILIVSSCALLICGSFLGYKIGLKKTIKAKEEKIDNKDNISIQEEESYTNNKYDNVLASTNKIDLIEDKEPFKKKDDTSNNVFIRKF